MVSNFGFKITFLNSFLCEKIDSFQKHLIIIIVLNMSDASKMQKIHHSEMTN